MKLQEALTAKKARVMHNDRLQKLPGILRKIDNNETIYYLDEAVFTVNQLKTRVWYPMRKAENNKLVKAKLSFRAVAAVAAIDKDGKIVALAMRYKSIRAF